MARDWKTALRRASFRGVSFWVEAETLDGGKNLVRHEGAANFAPRVEEMGAKVVSYNVTAYLVGDVSDRDAQALIAACRMPGAGLLRLPLDGAQMVLIEDFSRMRERDRAGYIAFGLTAVPAGSTAVSGLGLGDLASAFAAGLGAAAASFGGLF